MIAKKEWVSLEEALGLVLGRLETRLGSRKVEVRKVHSLPLIQCDFSLTADVIRNILMNSLQYSRPNSALIIQGSETENDISIQFLDEGPGISAQFLTSLFDRFSREQPHIPGGLGLGLSICRGFMEAMNGSIEAQNRTDGTSGSSVKITFKKGS